MKRIRANIEVLSQNEIEAIHKSTLRVLERVGIKVPNDECLDLCEKAGAKVDRDTYVVKIPAPLMEEILYKVKEVNKISTDNDKAEELKGFISTQVFIVDYKTKTRRYGVLDDVMKGIALVEKLKNIPVSNAVTIPSDIAYNMTDVISFQKIYTYSTKPGGTYILSTTSAKYIIQMAKAMGKEVGYLLETVSPLQFRKESLEMSLVFAKQGQPIRMGPMVMGGATGPVTIAGTLTMQNAEMLASLFMIHVLTSELCNLSAPMHSMDLRTMICSFGSPNQALFGMCAAQLAKYYGIKTGSNSGLTDALVPDFQGGFEKAANAIFSCLAGTTGIGAQGIAGADQGISLEQLVIDNEWIDAYNYILKGVEVNEDTIAEDLIENVGIGGNFLAEEHTAMYMRDNYWVSRIFNRDSWDAWQSEGAKDIMDRAHDFMEDATKNYKSQVPVIEESKLNEINYIVKCADEELARER